MTPDRARAWQRAFKALLVLAFLAGAWLLRRPLRSWFEDAAPPLGESPGDASSAQTRARRGQGQREEIDHYTCSMHPSVNAKEPGKCPICGMELVPVTKEAGSEGIVHLDDTRRQLIGVRTAPVVLAPMTTTFRAVGHVAYDESSLEDVNLKVHGWITKLFVNETGQRVARGQTLFTLYSPELYNAEQDFLLATRVAPDGSPGGGSRIEGLGAASRERLRLLGMSEPAIEAIAKSGRPTESVPFAAPTGGIILEKNVVEGASVDPGMRLYRIATLDKVWIEADVYEADLAHVRAGQHATVTLDYVDKRSYDAQDAKIAYVYPSVDPKSRTGHVRIELANGRLDLRPGMYANVELAADLGPRVQVPASAVVYTGPRRLVFVDLGEGRFRPVEVEVGAGSNGTFEVRSGLVPGDVVATSGVFLIAAEARIRTGATYWDSPGDGGATR